MTEQASYEDLRKSYDELYDEMCAAENTFEWLVVKSNLEVDCDCANMSQAIERLYLAQEGEIKRLRNLISRLVIDINAYQETAYVRSDVAYQNAKREVMK